MDSRLGYYGRMDSQTSGQTSDLTGRPTREAAAARLEEGTHQGSHGPD